MSRRRKADRFDLNETNGDFFYDEFDTDEIDHEVRTLYEQAQESIYRTDQLINRSENYTPHSSQLYGDDLDTEWDAEDGDAESDRPHADGNGLELEDDDEDELSGFIDHLKRRDHKHRKFISTAGFAKRDDPATTKRAADFKPAPKSTRASSRGKKHISRDAKPR